MPIADQKTVWPTPVLEFLGLEIDTINMVVRIPLDKLSDLKDKITQVLGRKKASLKELESLDGKMNFCTRAIPSARAFIRRVYDAMAGIEKSFYLISVTQEMREDLRAWLTFLDLYNVPCRFGEFDWIESPDLSLYTDSAGGDGGKGGTAYLRPHWVYLEWPKHWLGKDIMRDITFL